MFVAGGVSGTWIFSDTSPVRDRWYFLTSVYNKVTGFMSIRVNGVQEIPNINTSGLCASPGFNQVGGLSGITWNDHSGQRRFEGDMGGLGLNEYVLTPAEIEAHFEAGHL